MSRSKRPQAFRVGDGLETSAAGSEFDPAVAAYAYADAETDTEAEADTDTDAEMTQTLELREEQLIAHKDLRDLGEIEIRTEVEDVPGRLEVDAYREEVVVEHEAVGQTVTERDKPWEEDGVLIIPIYEEQLVVTKRLVLRERIRVRRVGSTERQLFEDTLRRERLVVEDPQNTGMVRERYPVETDGASDGSDGGATDGSAGGLKPAGRGGRAESESESHHEGGFFEHLVRKALE